MKKSNEECLPFAIYCKQNMLLISIIVSVIMLVLLLFLQYNASAMLSLDTKWILLSILPIVIWLILGRHIKGIKGAGIELILQDEIKFNLDTKLDFSEVKVMEKGLLDKFNKLSCMDKLSVSVLQFAEGNMGYSSEDIENVCKQLPNLKYFAIVDSDKKFKSLIPYIVIQKLTHCSNNEMSISNLNRKDIIQEFINSIRNKNYDEFNDIMISNYVSESEKTINVYLRFIDCKTSKFIQEHKVMPVLNATFELIGLINYRDIERKVINEIVKNGI